MHRPFIPSRPSDLSEDHWNMMRLIVNDDAVRKILEILLGITIDDKNHSKKVTYDNRPKPHTLLKIYESKISNKNAKTMVKSRGFKENSEIDMHIALIQARRRRNR